MEEVMAQARLRAKLLGIGNGRMGHGLFIMAVMLAVRRECHGGLAKSATFPC